MNDSAAIASAYRPPHQPWGLRAINAVGRRLARDGAGWIDISPAALMARAERETGLRDWGPENFREALDVLTRSLDQDARMNLGGRFVVRGFLTRLLSNRLKLQRDLTLHPQIRDVEIRRPVFIVGLPRTGSTLLQRLLARDPAVRSLQTWEMMFPSPPPEEATYASDPRIRKAASRLKLLDWAAPEFVMAHELAVNEPEECVSLLQGTLVTHAFELMNELSGYRAWFEQQDLRESYRYYKLQLQALSFNIRRDHWVLKCPVHTPGLDALMEVFPDAMVIQTHRDPVSVMPSVCSLFSVVQTALSDHADPRVLGVDWLGRWAGACEAAMAARARHGEHRAFDVAYKDMISDPFAVVRKVYDWYGQPYTPEAEAAMRAWLAGNPQHKHGKHRYRLEDYGLDAAQVQAGFARYQERFAAYL